MVAISRVSCEHYESGFGVSESQPRLSWRFEGEERDWAQRAYSLRIHRNGEVETYEVESAESVLVSWPSTPLVSREVADVEVQSHGKDGSSTGWARLRIEAALHQRQDWKASMVSAEEQDLDKPKRPFRLRKSFIASLQGAARLYVTAHGLFEAYLNGQRIGNEHMAPGWTVYSSRLPYSVYDVTGLIRPGETNTLGAWVAEGWYAGRLGIATGFRNVYGERLGLLAQLEVDGDVVARTDETWEWSYGRIVSSEIYDGETYDSTLDDSWTDGDWRPVTSLAFPSARLLTVQAPPVRTVERIPVKAIITTPSGKTVLDFGQNFAGVIEFTSQPPKSGTLVIKYAEVMEHAELGTRPLRWAKVTDRVVLGGELKGWQPKFTFHGFRYVQIEGWQGIGVDDIVGVVWASDMERTGHFECSHKLLNQLHSNVYYSTRSNTISIPSDCPQRDERLGWTGDIQVFTTTLGFLFDASGFLGGWFDDLAADQRRCNGVVPMIIPDVPPKKFNISQAIWGDVSVLGPWDMYNLTGDSDLLRRQYQSVVDWLDKGVLRDPETRLWTRDAPQLADWLAPQADPQMPARGPTDNWLVADAYLIHTTRVAGRICRTIGDIAKAEAYEREANDLLDTFHDMYVTRRSRIVSDTQTAICLLLHFDLLDNAVPEQRQILVDRLAKLVTRDFWQVSTGFAGTPIVLQTLAENDQLHHAYRMLLCRDCPSWLSPILLGATTIWERWDSMLADGSINPGSMTSFNHYALGSVADFLQSTVGGLSCLEPGWKKILIRPRPGGSLTHAKVSLLSPYGRCECRWEITGEELQVHVVVPPNCTAVVDLPGQRVEEIGSGARSFVVPWEADPRFPPVVVQPEFCQPVDKDWIP
ncbi:hypothetical protein JCM24511_00808 [Saitozyma sp. JCM 24511]|nr:hypothetical protein JCM24511_00808 [Saitozyma sp. JCM 24511]